MEVNSNVKKIFKISNNNIIKCPTCKKVANKLYTPFCSKKCSDIDLMKWLSDENHINLESKQKKSNINFFEYLIEKPDKTIYLIFLQPRQLSRQSRGLKILVSVVQFRPWAPYFIVSTVISLSQVSFRFRKRSENGLHKKKKIQI